MKKRKIRPRWIKLNEILMTHIHDLLTEDSYYDLILIETKQDLFECCGKQLQKLRWDNNPLPKNKFIQEIIKIQRKYYPIHSWSNFDTIKLVNQVNKLSRIKNGLWYNKVQSHERN